MLLGLKSPKNLYSLSSVAFFMVKPYLPIQDMSEGDFNTTFKKTHLDKDILLKKDLDAVEEIFGLGDKSANSVVGMLCCAEYHGHNYGCNYYYSPEAGIVDRLLDEIKIYQSKFLKIKKQVDNITDSLISKS